MSVAIITGAAGLVGSEAALHFAAQGMQVVGIDNDMRQAFFGEAASTRPNLERIRQQLPGYRHHDTDIRDMAAIEAIFRHYGHAIELVVHTAAQPSHDWAARAPLVDFGVNASGTLHMLEAARHYAPNAVFLFTSTNKVYGDAPNQLPLIERATRWEIDPQHAYAHGIAEDMAIDRSMHSLFGASKLAADILVQEYGRYFGMATACFRAGCLTGPQHAGTQLHGFLSYLVRCTIEGRPYSVLGYKGKQVRDNIHSADLVQAFDAFFRAPRSGEVYNIGGGRYSNCSMIEAIDLAQQITGQVLHWNYCDEARAGDHIWWISNVSRFQSHYPEWAPRHTIAMIMRDIAEAHYERMIEPAMVLV